MMRKRTRTYLLLTVAVLISALFAAGCTNMSISRTVYPVHLDPANAGPLTVTFIDVGQGDATLLAIGNRTVLIDAGPPDSGPGLVRTLEGLGVRNISLLVATHPHSDHIGGMHDVLARFPVDRVLDGTSSHTSGLYQDFLNEIDKKDIPYTEAERGQVFDIGDGLSVSVLGPPERKLSGDYNENSIVLLARYGRTGILLTGDAGINAEEELIRSGMPLSAEVLKVGHHGSSDATGAAFLAAVAPEVAVIPAGAGNDYGHPHHETLERLDKAVPLIYRTDRDGSVVVRTDGMKYSVTTGAGRTTVTGTSYTQAVTTETRVANTTGGMAVTGTLYAQAATTEETVVNTAAKTTVPVTGIMPALMPVTGTAAITADAGNITAVTTGIQAGTPQAGGESTMTGNTTADATGIVTGTISTAVTGGG